MQAITYVTAQSHLADAMARLCTDREPIIITREADEAIVMLSLDDYNALAETAHLSRSPANASRLLDAIDALEQGGGSEGALLAKRPTARGNPVTANTGC